MPPAEPQLSMFAPAGPSRDAIGPADALLDLPAALRPHASRLRLGTSSWSFPGWRGLVYDDRPGRTEAMLARAGLPAYAAHPLLGAVGIDRGFYAPLAADEYARYAAQVPSGFRFLVKAPGLVTDAMRRDANGRGREANPGYLDAAHAAGQFVAPCVAGLGASAGVLLFQFSPLPSALLREPAAWVASLGRFLAALPRPLPDGAEYAVELRDARLLTPRLMATLREHGVAYCLGLHDRMPDIGRQIAALDHLEQGRAGPLVARWTLRQGIGYEQARQRYAPFRGLVDPDPGTREALAERAARALRSGTTVTVIANNKAEGSAPLTLAALADAIARRL